MRDPTPPQSNEREADDPSRAPRPVLPRDRVSAGAGRRTSPAPGPPIIIPVRSGGGLGDRWYTSTRGRLGLAAVALLVVTGGVLALRDGDRPVKPAVVDGSHGGAVVAQGSTPISPSTSPSSTTSTPVTAPEPSPASTPTSPATTSAAPSVTAPAPVTTPSPSTAAATVPAATAPAATAPAAPVRRPATVAEARSGVAGAVAAYATAIGSRDADAIALAYPAISDEDRAAWRGFFVDVSEMRATLAARDVRVVGPDRAEARVSGTYIYSTGTPPRRARKAVAFQGTFVRDAAGAWRLDVVR